jgi:hypothetical protein
MILSEVIDKAVDVALNSDRIAYNNYLNGAVDIKSNLPQHPQLVLSFLKRLIKIEERLSAAEICLSVANNIQFPEYQQSDDFEIRLQQVLVRISYLEQLGETFVISNFNKFEKFQTESLHLDNYVEHSDVENCITDESDDSVRGASKHPTKKFKVSDEQMNETSSFSIQAPMPLLPSIKDSCPLRPRNNSTPMHLNSPFSPRAFSTLRPRISITRGVGYPDRNNDLIFLTSPLDKLRDTIRPKHDRVITC